MSGKGPIPRLRRWLRARRVAAAQAHKDADRTRQQLLDEIYLLRDVGGEWQQRARALQARVDELERERADLRAPLPTPPAVSVRAEAAPAPVPVADTLRGGPVVFVDVTELALHAGQTGIQREVREIARALLAAPPPGYRVQPVCAPAGKPWCMVDATLDRAPGTTPQPMGPRIAPRNGDVFLGLDHAMAALVANGDEVAEWRKRGVRTWFVCNDVLPLSNPAWFPPQVTHDFSAWLGTIARVGDGIACISIATQSALQPVLDGLRVQRDPALVLGHFGLGADIPTGASTDSVPARTAALPVAARGAPAFLMVGTLEPRKGHAQALEACNRLWADGEDVVLVIVGRPGWLTEVVQRRIRHHDEFGKRLVWYMDADDDTLDNLYAACTCLLAASHGEGFGLPLVEAARHGLPILARDLPVFREVAGAHATYFASDDAASLARAMRNWLTAYRRGSVPDSRNMPRLTWAESARQLMDLVLSAPAHTIEHHHPSEPSK